MADINGTNPNLWNAWRSSLLRQLYTGTRRALRRGLENPVDRQDLIDETQSNAMEILLSQGYARESVEALWSYLGDDYFLRETATEIAWQSHHRPQ